MQIRMPPTAWVSIAHRASGVLMVLSIPFCVYLFGLSLSGEDGFQQSINLLHSPLVLLFGWALSWAIGHHLLAGIRFLLLDIDVGLSKDVANKSALAVLAGGGLLMLLLFGAWI